MQALNVLILEDFPDDAELLLHELRRAGFEPQWRRVDNQADYSASLNARIDLILADYNLPDINAVKALHLLQERRLDIPFIVVTGTVTEQIVVECVKQGASDYLLKDRLARLGAAVTHALVEKKLRDEKRAADDALRHYAAELEQRVVERTQELQNAKEFAEAILNSTSDAIILIGTNETIEHVNPAFERLFGYPAREVLGQPLTTLAEPGDRDALIGQLRAVDGQAEPRRSEMRVCRRDGTPFTVDVALAPLSESNRAGGVVCSVWDMTQRKLVEENLRQALMREKELGDLKSRFTSMVSHEFRTPLSVIQSSSDLLKMYSERMSVDKRIGQIDRIQSQVQRLTSLLNDILLISKGQTVGLDFNPVPIDLLAFSQDLINETRQTVTTHQITFRAEGDAFGVNADVKLMHQAITNLLSNAVKYSPAGSTVFMRLERRHDEFVIQIQDQGDGIDEEDQQHLFEIFYRAKSAQGKPGTGLGLPIVKQAIEAHGGAVAFESHPGGGTTFTLYLPVASADIPQNQ